MRVCDVPLEFIKVGQVIRRVWGEEKDKVPLYGIVIGMQAEIAGHRIDPDSKRSSGAQIRYDEITVVLSTGKVFKCFHCNLAPFAFINGEVLQAHELKNFDAIEFERYSYAA
jgi:hypothetical protein